MTDSTQHHTTPHRRPFQGVWNIVRFNYESFVFVAGIVLVNCYFGVAAQDPFDRIYNLFVAAVFTIFPFVALLVSWYVYDYSPLYTLTWLDPLLPQTTGAALNIHAGFDETSALLNDRYPALTLDVVDFYDPAHHTERSIKHARQAYPPFPGTRTASTTDLKLTAGNYQVILLILAVHEIRDEAERITFLSQLRTALVPGGRIIVVEHARDFANFLAYTFGFFHFLSVRQLTNDFAAAGLRIAHRSHITPWIRVYSLD